MNNARTNPKSFKNRTPSCLIDENLKCALKRSRCQRGIFIPLEEHLATHAKQFQADNKTEEPFKTVEIAAGYVATLNWKERILCVTGGGVAGFIKFEYPLAIAGL